MHNIMQNTELAPENSELPWFSKSKFLVFAGRQAGVRPGWTLKLADGKVVTKLDLREVATPVELEFQRHMDELRMSCG